VVTTSIKPFQAYSVLATEPHQKFDPSFSNSAQNNQFSSEKNGEDFDLSKEIPRQKV
jgi:hypothetical protein